MSRNFYMPTRVGKTEEVYGRSRVNLKIKRGSTFYVYERPCIQIAAILFTRVKVLCAYAHKIYVTAEIHPKGGCTWRFNLLSGVLFLTYHHFNTKQCESRGHTNLRSAFLQRSYDWNKHCFIVRLEQFGQQGNTICFPDGLLVFSTFTAAP